jgi:hypothetical protein
MTKTAANRLADAQEKSDPFTEYSLALYNYTARLLRDARSALAASGGPQPPQSKAKADEKKEQNGDSSKESERKST